MRKLMKVIVFLYIVLCVSIALNITVLREVSGFIFLSFIPGYLFINMLELNGRDNVETIVFSAGLSIAFLMFVGLLLNGISFEANFYRPLSHIPLIIIISALTLILFLFNLKKKNVETGTFSFPKVNVKNVVQVSFLLILPVISIVGALYHNISILLFMILAVAILCLACVLQEKLLSTKIFPFVVIAVSFALLFHTVLISKYFLGSDIFSEFYVYKLTEVGGVWRTPGPVMSYSLIDSLNSVLSITILPTVYTAILQINSEIFFKIYYPFVLALLPLIVYKMYETQTSKKVAFLSAIFIVTSPIVFYGPEPLSLARQLVGQFFFVLSMYLVTENRFDLKKRRVLLVIFSAALIVSHYSIAYIFLLYVFFIFIISNMNFFAHRKIKTSVLSPRLILLLVALTFAWYIYVSDAPLNQLSSSVQRIVSLLSTDLFNISARTQQSALQSLSPTSPTSLVGMIHRSLFYLEHFFIGIGVIVLIFKPREFNLHLESRLAAIISMLILALCVIIPNFAVTLNATRFYAIVIPFLVPLFVLGCIFFIKLLKRFVAPLSRKIGAVHLGDLGLYVASFVLIFTFLFQVGFVNHVTSDYPYSYSLDLDRKEVSNDVSIRATTHSLYFLDVDVFSAKWLQNVANSSLKIYADANSRSSVLKSYAFVPDERILLITNNTELESQAYIYLKYLNVQVGVVSTATGGFFNSSDIAPMLEDCNKIYSNGKSDVYFVP